MDSELQKLQSIPTVIKEDASRCTPKNTNAIELPWSDISKLLSSKYSNINSVTPQDLFVGSFENCHLGRWDGNTPQDIYHFH